MCTHVDVFMFIINNEEHWLSLSLSLSLSLFHSPTYLVWKKWTSEEYPTLEVKTNILLEYIIFFSF